MAATIHSDFRGRPVAPGPQVTVDYMSRGEFLDYFEDEYESGQHVSIFGPTQRGKTTLCHQLLNRVISPEFKCLVLAGKPPSRDPVMAQAAERLNLRIVEEWPPPKSPLKDRRMNGWVLRPKHNMHDHKATNANLSAHFRQGMNDMYATPPTKPRIIVADEAHLIQNTYGLKNEMEAPLMRGAPVVSLWCLIQRNRNMTYFVYNSPEWLIIYNEPDKSNIERYSDIGGIDPRLIMAILPSLKTETGDNGKATISEALCIKRSGPEVFIVGTK